jgi:hypothetical protein
MSRIHSKVQSPQSTWQREKEQGTGHSVWCEPLLSVAHPAITLQVVLCSVIRWRNVSVVSD